MTVVELQWVLHNFPQSATVGWSDDQGILIRVGDTTYSLLTPKEDLPQEWFAPQISVS